MTNYGKPRYIKIIDLEFTDIDTTVLPQKKMSIRQYYTERYNLTIENSKQPLLIIEEKRKKVNSI